MDLVEPVTMPLHVEPDDEWIVPDSGVENLDILVDQGLFIGLETTRTSLTTSGVFRIMSLIGAEPRTRSGIA